MYVHVCSYSLKIFITGDTFSTPPNSPPPRASSSSAASNPDSQRGGDKDSLTSYEKAVNLNSVWKEEPKTNHAMPQHVSSPVTHHPPPSTPPANLLPGYPNIAIVDSSPAAVRVGFFDTTVETTPPGELPGSTHGPSGGREGVGVITTPPHSANSSTASKTSLAGSFGFSVTRSDSPKLQKPTSHDSRETRSSSPRSRSIEEVDRDREKLYAPLDTHSQPATKRKSSVTPSQFSVLSVSVWPVHTLYVNLCAYCACGIEAPQERHLRVFTCANMHIHIHVRVCTCRAHVCTMYIHVHVQFIVFL